MSDDPYTEDYFLRGKEKGLSLYEDYRWLPNLTVPMVCAMVRHLEIRCEDTVLDFGCARGYIVRAFREMGYSAWGHDKSKWVLENADEAAKEYMIADPCVIKEGNFDWVIAKDVLEHIHDVADVITWITEVAHKGVFVIVPLSSTYGEKYVVPEYELDVTHVHRRTLADWVRWFLRPGWRVEASYRVEGIKDNYSQYPTGNGFICARRIE